MSARYKVIDKLYNENVTEFLSSESGSCFFSFATPLKGLVLEHVSEEKKH